MIEKIKASLKRGLIFYSIPGLIIYIALTIISALDNLWSSPFNLVFGRLLFWGAGLIASLILILTTGLILGSKLLQRPAIINFEEKFLSKIPIAKWFFGKNIFTKKDLEKMRVALVEYPSPGFRQIAFVAGTQKFIKDGKEIVFYKILIPTVPLPATGTLTFTEITSEKIIFLKNSASEIIKLILSCGFINVDQLEAEETKKEN